MKSLLPFLGLLVVFPGQVPAANKASEELWMLAYFRQRYEGRVEFNDQGEPYQVPLAEPMSVEQLHLAYSEDGRRWTPLNDNEPIWEQRLRDPFVKRATDGRWHVVGTGGYSYREDRSAGPVCLHAVSEDLITWEKPEALPLMKGVRDDDGRPARNIWAPEWFADETTGDTVLLWSSSFEDTGWKKSRLWFSRTKDWETFTSAKVLFDPPYSVIDGNLWEHKGKYYLFHKEEEFRPETGERRAIRVAIADQLEGPYEIHEGPLNDGQIVPTITEGPSIMPNPEGEGWLLLYDYCMTNRFGLSTSPDLLNWTIQEDISFPRNARHASAFQVTREELNNLKEAFPEKAETE
jgi:hypothetical protein